MDFSLVPRYLESPARQLFRRCLQCPDSTPSCPPCDANEECSLNVNTCNQCGYAICIKVSNPSSSSGSSTSSPAGPIAGGVIGGIILVGAVVFLVYWFYMRPKRRNWAEQLGKLKEIPTPDNRSFIEERNKRASTHTVASVKTTGSRASIPIAFIPGVTNGGGSYPQEMVPPVPPIPAAGGSHGTLSPRMNTGTEVFFRPESSYSDIDTRSITGRSVRSSVASEFHDDAIANPMPAQAAMAYKPTSISVSSRSNPGSPSRSPTSTPPLSHQSSIASRMRTQGPITGQSGQARQIMITRSQSNLRENNHNAGGMNTIAELDDTSNGAPTPRILASELDDTSVGYRTPKLGVDRSGTASPRSMLSDDAEEMMRDGRWRKPSLTGGYGALKSPDYNHPPVSAAGQSTFSRNSPVSAVGWDPQSNIRNTIRDATSLAYGNGASYAGGKSQHNGNQPNSPFADRHAMNN